jgi:hypothetical protein
LTYGDGLQWAAGQEDWPGSWLHIHPGNSFAGLDIFYPPPPHPPSAGGGGISADSI